jgi:hypothetical protein
VFRGIASTRLRLATAWQAERGGYSLREMAQQHGPFEYFNRLLGNCFRARRIVDGQDGRREVRGLACFVRLKDSGEAGTKVRVRPRRISASESMP